MFIWLVVVLPVLILRGPGDPLSQIAIFFSKAPFVTFGGAYAVLSYIIEHAVNLGWLTDKDMQIETDYSETDTEQLKVRIEAFIEML